MRLLLSGILIYSLWNSWKRASAHGTKQMTAHTSLEMCSFASLPSSKFTTNTEITMKRYRNTIISQCYLAGSVSPTWVMFVSLINHSYCVIVCNLAKINYRNDFCRDVSPHLKLCGSLPRSSILIVKAR